MAVGQSHLHPLTQRLREHARSHIKTRFSL